MKKKMKTLAKKSISTLKSLVSARKKHFGKIFAIDSVFSLVKDTLSIFAIDSVSFTKLKTNFRKIFVKASSSQNLENSGF